MKHKIVAVSLLCLALSATSVHATFLYWSANGTTVSGVGTWDTGNHWGSSTSGPFSPWVNANSDTADFSASGASFGAVLVTTPITINGTLQLDVTPGTWPDWSFNGSSIITFGVRSTLTTTGTHMINCPYAGTITKAGTTSCTFNNANGNVTKFIFNAGTVSFANASRFGNNASPGADFLTFNGGTVSFNTTTAWTMGGSITVNSGNGTITASSSTITVTQDKPITWNSGNLTVNVVPLVLSSTTSSGSGTLTLNTGKAITCNAAGVVPNTVLVSLTLAATSFNLNGFDQTVRSISGTAGTFACGGNTLTVNAPAGETYSSVISSTASGKFVKNGTGVLTLSGSSTGFLGTSVINNGTIGVGGANIFGNTAPATVTINGGKLANNSATGRSIPAAVTLSIAGDFTVDDSLLGTANGQILFNGPATLQNGNRTITVNQTSAGAPNLGLGGAVGQDVAGRGIIKNGNATLALTAVNTYSGDTTINAGTININGTSTLGNAAGTLHLSGGILSSTASRTPSSAPVANPIDVTAGSFITTSSTAATVDLNLSSSTIGGSAGSITFSNAAASGTGLFQPRFSGSGFNFGLPIGIANGGVAGPTTALNSYNTTGADQTFSGVISGNGSYVRNASTSGTGGRTIFTQANTYSGGTTVNHGTLQVDNSTGSGTGSGTVTVGSDGTLAGIGTISGAVTVSGTLAPGDAAIGTLTFGSSLALSGTTSMEINKTLGTADKIVMSSGTVTLGGNLTVVNLAGTLALGDTFTLISGTMAGGFTSYTLPALTTGLAWDTSQLSPGGRSEEHTSELQSLRHLVCR